MAKKRLTMRQIREVLRLKYGDSPVSDRAIAVQLGVARSTVQDYLVRVSGAGLTWPLPEDLTDAVLEQRLFGRPSTQTGLRRRVEPDWAALARELKRPAVTLLILWDEYRAAHPDGYGYSRFCDLYREFERKLTPTMRQQHVAGDKVLVDYSGKRISIADPVTGEVKTAELFVAVLGASNYTYAEATWSQKLPDWIGAHVRMLAHFGKVPRLVVPDNLKSGVHRPSFYDPEANQTYGRMADHYGLGILPARPYKPRDKAKVEAGVRVAQTYILGRLRNVTFFSLTECNQAINAALEQINGRVMRKLGVCRRDLFLQVELPAMRPLPHAEWLALLLDHEVTLRRQKRFEARAGRAKLRQTACVEDVDYRAVRGLDRTLFLKLATCQWIGDHRHVILCGPTGIGKSWLACALGQKACHEDRSVLYHRVPRLFAALDLARGDGRYAKLLASLARADLLILDDWGPQVISADHRRDLMEIVEDRYGRGSLLITSQVPVNRWHEVIGDPTLADAILDRIVHAAYRIDLDGESMRKRPRGVDLE